MKNLIMKSTLFLGAAVLISSAAQAQSLKVSVPFAFEANGKSLPAGNYSVQSVSENSGGMLAMRNIATNEGALLMVRNPIAYSSEDTKLVFRQAADGYYLSEVWDGTRGRAVTAPRGRNSILAATKVVIPATK